MSSDESLLLERIADLEIVITATMLIETELKVELAKISAAHSELERKKQAKENYSSRLEARVKDLDAELARMKKHFRQPTHGPCCTCQQCGQYYDDCRCMLDEVATDNARLRECLKRIEGIVQDKVIYLWAVEIGQIAREELKACG